MNEELDYILSEPYIRGYANGRADALEEVNGKLKNMIQTLHELNEKLNTQLSNQPE